ncbi:MAG: RNA 2',3'-cyclic phosphodiesterase [Pseudomonadota bacterium]
MDLSVPVQFSFASMYRLFAALPIRPDIASELQPLQERVSGASWRPAENFHITLRFFGHVDRHVAQELDFELGEIAAPQMKLRLKGAGWFGRREPSALWVGIDHDQDLARLAGACERAARRLGLPAERRRFVPHVTLAYCHGTTPEDAKAFAARHADFESSPFWADRFHLYSSHFGKGPSRYVAEADYPLA